tara:strand:+ start:691 stop:1047 length:357 start_codon:yes stop_codon:yes gene_type:complete
MAHFAKIDNNNIVTQVICVNNGDILDSNGDESETVGVKYCQALLGGEWVQTSYNSNFRKQYAGGGFTYNPTDNVFVSPSPFPSWVLNATHDWEAPVSKPDDGKRYVWDESVLGWVQLR